MKKYKFFAVFVVLCMTFILSTGTFMAYPSTKGLVKKYSGADSPLNAQELMAIEAFVSYIQFSGDEGYEEFADEIRKGILTKKTVEVLMNEGFYTEYYQEFKNAGLISAEYNLPGGNTNTSISNNNEVENKPETVNTTKCDEKIMWAKSQVNVRENGSTSYKKVGSLQAGEQVTVTGVDSTGWYEIRKSDGTVGHVSDKYLTEEDPSVKTTPEEETEEVASKRESEIISIDGRTVIWYNAETEEEEEVVFSENTPLEEVEEMAMKYLINGAELVEPTSEEITPTEEVAEMEEIAEEPAPLEDEKPVIEETTDTEPIEIEDSAEEPQDKTEKMREFVQGPIFIFGSIIIGLLAFIGGIVTIVINKKRR